MKEFTARVELHDADPKDYAVLHEIMEKEGFTRIILGAKGVAYHLPTAEYNYKGDITLNQVGVNAGRAAETTKKRYSILVTESKGRTWINLEPVKKSKSL